MALTAPLLIYRIVRNPGIGRCLPSDNSFTESSWTELSVVEPVKSTDSIAPVWSNPDWDGNRPIIEVELELDPHGVRRSS